MDDFQDPLHVARRELGDKFDDLEQLDRVVLREGPRSKKFARYITIKNRHTGDVHHHTLTIESGQKRQGTWELDDKRSVTLSDDGTDEIGRLMAFLQGVRQPTPTTLPPPTRPTSSPSWPHRSQPTAPASAASPKWAKSAPPPLDLFAAALTWGRFAHALDRLDHLLAQPSPVEALRTFLSEHPWLYASEHATPLDAPSPFLLHRHPSGRVELLHVHTPQAGHAELTQALLQAPHHLATYEADTAKIILGLDDEALLRGLNRHLDRVELLTFTDLQTTGRRILTTLAATIQERR